MDLKFSFGASNPLPLTAEGAGSASAPGPGSSVLELRVSLTPDGGEMVCEGMSGDGVSYGRALRPIAGDGAGDLATALRSVLARGGAELPEPLLGSVTAVVLSLGGREEETLEALGLAVSPGAQLAALDGELQARTGIAAGTPIRR